MHRRIQDEWRSRVGKVRADATALKLISLLPAIPVVTVRSAARHSNVQFAAANESIRSFCDLGILTPVSESKRNRTFEAREILDAFAALERQLASPDGDTRITAPARAVPAREKRRAD